MKNSPAKKQKRLIKYGDVFSIGNHILACGDARNEKLINKILKNKKISLVLCDPPYGIDYTKSKEGFSTVKKNKNIQNDDITSEKVYADFTHDWIMPILPHLARKNTFYIFNSDLMLFALRDGMIASNVKFSQLLVWIKNHAVIGRKDYLPMHELIAVGWHGIHKFCKAQDKSVLYHPKPHKSGLHPTQKPIPILRRLILNSTNVHDVVYDCFGGSGSTLIACEQTKRTCVMIESDPEYCKTIIDRCYKLFNLKSKKYEKY